MAGDLSLTTTIPVTVKITSFENETVTVTSGEPSTTYQPVFVTDLVTRTITTYTDSGSRSPIGSKSSAACSASGLAKLSALPGTALSAVCSCLAHSASTTSSTLYITSAIASTTTSYPGDIALPTTTAYFLARLVVTVTLTPANVVIPLTATLTSSATTTLALAAPSFTQIFGPRAGCNNIGVFNSTDLDTSITDAEVAAQQCKAICKQEPRRKFLWVQKMLADYGALEPRFECSLNYEVFDKGTDLVCGGDTGIYGEACGFTVLGRGVPDRM
ncbi:hypothetical protein B0A48_00926 [Cryoendolithus antarcticus]|uniref:Uncharacterized protein n=1 Tax=Cryoendolithus antarcticus TaxID=1507870 RepID=A0A1V8TRR7_9PEZI|nr:hypothetical protein B0A48_00926 [Cryoendolithus antarcticus]